MATIKFYLQSDKIPSGIYVRLREGRNIDAKAKTNFLINPNDWDKQKGSLKNKKSENAKKLNEELSNLAHNLLSHFNQSIGKTQIDSVWLKEFINPSIKKDSIPNKLVDYFDYYAKHKKSQVKPSTITKVNVNKHKLEKFQKETKREYLIKDVNSDFKIEFEKFCEKEGYAQNTIARTFRYIKTVCYHARRNGIETHFQLDSIVMKNEKIDIIYLTENEIEKISKMDFKLNHLNNARDWLIVCCETAQRVSDFLRFSKEMIRKDEDDYFIDFTQIKTEKEMSVFITPRLSALLDRNGGNFPRKISSAKLNDYIKSVCKIAGLTQEIQGSKTNKVTKRKEKGIFPKWELISTKIGRRSFASNYFGKLPNTQIMCQTGHVSETSYLLYVGKSQMSMAKQLAAGIKELNRKNGNY